jgi:hypothetical protein
MPNAAWTAYWVLVVVGIVLGLLCGAGSLSGLGLGIFMAVAIAVFVSWAVLMIDPKRLADHPTYKNEDETQHRGRW